MLYWAFSLCELHTHKHLRQIVSVSEAYLPRTLILPLSIVPQHRWHRVLWTPTQIAVHELSSYCGFMMPAQLDASDTNADCAITSSQKEAPGDRLSIQQVYLCSGSGNEWVNEWGKWAKDHSIHSFLSNKRFSLTIHYGFSFFNFTFSLQGIGKFDNSFSLIFFLLPSHSQFYFVVRICDFSSHHVITPHG